MSTTIPPLSPDPESEQRREFDRLMREWAMAGRSYATLAQEIRPASPPASASSTMSLWIPSAITAVLQGLTLLGIIGFAFWFGTLNATVTTTADKVKSLGDAVSGDRRESLSNRMSVIETKLENMDRKLDQLAKPKSQ